MPERTDDTRLATILLSIIGAFVIYGAVAGSESGSDRALEELRLAYARGELTDDEYEQRRETLEGDTKSGEH